MKLSLETLAKTFALVVMALGISISATEPIHADVLEVDISGVDPRFQEVFLSAEATWESRIQNYSSQLPQALLVHLSKLRILAFTVNIDGVGGVLGNAGPEAVVSFQSGDEFNPRLYAVAVRSSMRFDLADLADLEADGILEKVILHEMAHAMGFGSLWVENELIGPLAAVGQTEYIGGPFAIQQFAIDINSPGVQFVPIEQQGGGGTMFSHWSDVPPFFNQTFTSAFTKEVMTGFACDLDPVTGAGVCPPGFLANATWGAMADLGFEVAGINDNTVDPETGRGGARRWPKVTGNGFDPFGTTEVPVDPGIKFHLVDIRIPIMEVNDGGNSSKPTDVIGSESDDPYALRAQRWVK